MKKVIIALLVIASLFAFVSCKDEVTYDNFAKMKRLDTKTEKGAVVDKAMDVIFAGEIMNPGLFDLSTTLTFNVEDPDYGTGTVTIEASSNEEPSFGTLTFKGNMTFDDETYTNKKAYFRSTGPNTLAFFSAKDEDTQITGSDASFLEYLFISSDSGECTVDAKASVKSSSIDGEYSAVVATTEDTPKNFVITGLEVNFSENGYNSKEEMNIANILETDFYATDFDITIKYNEGTEPLTTGVKTIKATCSVFESNAGYIRTVSFDGKTYGNCLL